MTRVGGIVLCGGQSTRMGRPKAWLPVGGEVMLQRVVRVVREAVGVVVVVAAPGQDVPPLDADVAIVRDEVADSGPLAGFVAGLRAMQGRADAVYLSSCDVPFLTPAFVRMVTSSLGQAASAVPLIAGRLHPLAAAYSLAVLPLAAAELAGRRLRMTALFDLFPTRFLDESELRDADPHLLSLRNVNTPAEYDELKPLQRIRDEGPK
jgi:molybdopterin-guanine dinucleotide biosynthesis protein A